MKKNLYKIQMLRFIVQILFLFLLPGLFTFVFSQIGKIYTGMIKGNTSFIAVSVQTLSVVSVILLTIAFGRFFCGWICAFGTMNDIIHIISEKIFKINYKISPKADSILKYLKYIILLFIIAFMWTLGTNAFSSSSPWDAFAEITQFPEVINNYSIGFALLILIMIGAFFIERFFCRYLCPLGALFSIISKIRIFKISKPNDKCGKCRLCTFKCSMGIDLYKMDSVKNGECINCLKCVEVCPKKNAKTNVFDENINPVLASSAAIAAFGIVYSLTSTASNSIKVPISSSISQNININQNSGSLESSSSKNEYTDGTYTGTGTGHRPGLSVAVTIKSGKISSIEITSHNETPGYYEEAFNTVTNEIIQSQSTDVDAVTGATRSSEGIMMAVKAALNKAKK